jgi:hypothetical protein
LIAEKQTLGRSSNFGEEQKPSSFAIALALLLSLASRRQSKMLNLFQTTNDSKTLASRVFQGHESIYDRPRKIGAANHSTSATSADGSVLIGVWLSRNMIAVPICGQKEITPKWRLLIQVAAPSRDFSQ